MLALSCKAEQQRVEVLEMGPAKSSGSDYGSFGEKQEVVDFGQAFLREQSCDGAAEEHTAHPGT